MTVIHAEGMMCNHCKMTVEKALKAVPGVENAELKALAAKDPREFEKAMRNHFFKNRQAKAQKLLALREAWLNAQTEELRKVALEKLKNALREDVEGHLEFQKKLLKNTEENIRSMERRLAAMKLRYEKHSAGKEKYLEKRLNSPRI